MQQRSTSIDPREGGVVRNVRGPILILRVIFYVVVISITVVSFLRVEPGSPAWELSVATGGWWAVALALALATGVLAIDLLTPRKKVSTLSGVFLGLLAGVLAAIAVSFLLDLLAQGYALEGQPIITTLKILFGVCFCYLGVSVVLQTQDDFRLVIPYVEFAKQIRGQRPMMLDTSALVDGRILDLSLTGMVQAPIIVPRFVIDELHALADSSDKLKRSRGRRGLDMLSRLQRESPLDITIEERPAAGAGVDQMLVELAREQQAIILTTDTGLERVAGVQSVPVVNMHNVAGSMRSVIVTGETLRIHIVKAGEQAGQGVGYLDDGGMVVVENGGGLIGRTVAVVVTGALQTSAGRLTFARAPDAENEGGGEEPRDDEPAPRSPRDDAQPGDARVGDDVANAHPGQSADAAPRAPAAPNAPSAPAGDSGKIPRVGEETPGAPTLPGAGALPGAGGSRSGRRSTARNPRRG
ncbi:MAG: PIN/TRAM domain-containing protein [Phycisphaerales bacterium]|nr:MAG: PIN/TRAM domain-containing protein [Phycisphaerales bacterium]